jgi:hypothetical protein
VTYKNINDFDKQAQKAIDSKMEKALSEMAGGSYAESLKERIVKRTQLGIGVNDDGSSFKLPTLAQNTKDQRAGKTRWITVNGKKIKMTKDSSNFKQPKLAGTTTASKANNTATGQLLKSIIVIKTKVGEGIKFVFKIVDNRSKDMYGNQNNTSNKKISQYLKAMGRGFFGFTRAQRNEIAREIRQVLNKLLK